jgi:aminopeptidase N
LKEGLTVFRDQEFSADLVGTTTGRAVKRIEDVRVLRQVQFSEDAGPMAHPVRPDSFVEINNFYTVTIYEKGAEVVRMYYTLLGHDGFRKGMDLYFERHDGQAVECDDFRAAMADSSGRDLTQFERWYSQAGTPRVSVVTAYDAEAQTYDIKLTQSCPALRVRKKITVSYSCCDGFA